MLIKPYNPAWADQFQRIKEVLESTLCGIPLVIEHIGSTSVKDLKAKSIIDINIAFENPDDFEKIKNQLAKIGYSHQGDLGITGREAFKRDGGIILKVLDDIEHHLYVSHQDAVEFKRHILFRDFLRKNKWARVEYENLKLQIAQENGQDRKRYAALKETRARDFVEKILALAEKDQWCSKSTSR